MSPNQESGHLYPATSFSTDLLYFPRPVVYLGDECGSQELCQANGDEVSEELFYENGQPVGNQTFSGNNQTIPLFLDRKVYTKRQLIRLANCESSARFIEKYCFSIERDSTKRYTV